jgi:hypothetical protein
MSPIQYRVAFLLLIQMLVFSAAAGQQQMDLGKPEDALKAMQKIYCSLEDGAPAYFWWKGSVYSRVPGEPDRHLFNVEGMSARTCKRLSDPARGMGFRLVSRELLLYLDPHTDHILKTWKNPFSGYEREVFHVFNDPVNQPPAFAGPETKFNGTIQHGRFILSLEVPLFYRNPLGGDFQEYVGGNYHALEMFNFFGTESELLDATQKEVKDLTITWHRISDWLPWMEMGDRPGMLIFVTSGKRLASIEKVPARLRNEIHRSYPLYLQPPPLDDIRPNETSWTYFKKTIEGRRKPDKP